MDVNQSLNNSSFRPPAQVSQTHQTKLQNESIYRSMFEAENLEKTVDYSFVPNNANNHSIVSQHPPAVYSVDNRNIQNNQNNQNHLSTQEESPSEKEFSLYILPNNENKNPPKTQASDSTRSSGVVESSAPQKQQPRLSDPSPRPQQKSEQIFANYQQQAHNYSYLPAQNTQNQTSQYFRQFTPAQKTASRIGDISGDFSGKQQRGQDELELLGLLDDSDLQEYQQWAKKKHNTHHFNPAYAHSSNVTSSLSGVPQPLSGPASFQGMGPGNVSLSAAELELRIANEVAQRLAQVTLMNLIYLITPFIPLYSFFHHIFSISLRCTIYIYIYIYISRLQIQPASHLTSTISLFKTLIILLVTPSTKQSVLVGSETL